MSTTISDSLGVVKTVLGVEIHATKGGKFAAIVGGERVTLASLAAVAKRIEGRSQPVEAMEIGGSYRGMATPERRTVARVTKNNQIYHLVPRDQRFYPGEFMEESDRAIGYYVFDEDAFAKLSALAEQYRALAAEWRAVVNGLQEITPATWPEIQAERQAQAAEAGTGADDAARAGERE